MQAARPKGHSNTPTMQTRPQSWFTPRQVMQSAIEWQQWMYTYFKYAAYTACSNCTAIYSLTASTLLAVLYMQPTTISTTTTVITASSWACMPYNGCVQLYSHSVPGLSLRHPAAAAQPHSHRLAALLALVVLSLRNSIARKGQPLAAHTASHNTLGYAHAVHTLSTHTRARAPCVVQAVQSRGLALLMVTTTVADSPLRKLQ